jgi:hypothetical protein
MATEYEKIASKFGARVPGHDAREIWSKLPDTEHIMSSFSAMERYRALFGWAIPSEEALAAMAPYGPFLEIGAGSGYWAYEMRQRGIEIIPTDKIPMNPHYFNPKLKPKKWVERMRSIST